MLKETLFNCAKTRMLRQVSCDMAFNVFFYNNFFECENFLLNFSTLYIKSGHVSIDTGNTRYGLPRKFAGITI